MKILKVVIIVLIVAILALSVLFFLNGGSLSDRMVDFGDSAVQKGSYDKAERYYQFAIRLDADNVSAREAMAEAYTAAGNYTKAEAYISDCIQAFPEEAAYYLALCRIYVAQDKLSDAAAMLDAVDNETAAQAIAALRPAAPTFYPDPGDYSENISASMLADSASTCYFSKTEEFPSLRGDKYVSPVALPPGETVFTAVAVSADGIVSSVSTARYTLTGVIAAVTLKDLTVDAMVRAALGKSLQDVLWTDELWSITELHSVDENGKSYGPILRLDDFQYLQGIETLYLQGQDSLDLERLSTLPALRTLTLKDCGITTQDLESISKLTSLEYLNLSGNRIAGVSELGKLKSLKRLNLSSNSVSDLSGLEGAVNLDAIDLSENAVEDITPLKGLPNLRELYGANLLVKDLTPLSGLTNLAVLELQGCDVTDLTPLENSASLQTLVLSGNQVSDVTPLAGCTSLIYCDLSRNALTNIGGLAKVSTLEYLNVADNDIAALPSSMSGMTALRTLILSGNDVGSVAPLAACANLAYLNIEYCPVGDISPLASLGKLETVMAFGTRIQDRGGLEENGVTVYWDLNRTS